MSRPQVLLNAVLLALLAATSGLNWAIRPDPERRNWLLFRDMVYSPAYKSFSANPVFPDGKTLQPPVPGTIPRGLPPLRYGSTPEEATRAGVELESPFPADDARVLARGQRMYETFCAVCHGPAGAGDGAVAKRGFPPPPSLLAEKAVSMPDGRMFHVLTYGQGNMPAYAAQILREDRWKAILYVRSLQNRQVAKGPQERSP